MFEGSVSFSSLDVDEHVFSKGKNGETVGSKAPLPLGRVCLRCTETSYSLKASGANSRSSSLLLAPNAACIVSAVVVPLCSEPLSVAVDVVHSHKNAFVCISKDR